jgi:hypothetical protein
MSRFQDAILRSESGDVIANRLSGSITLPKAGANLQTWNGRFEFRTARESVELLFKTARCRQTKLELPGGVVATITVTDGDGNFRGSGKLEQFKQN